jgi:hypothetical protein
MTKLRAKDETQGKRQNSGETSKLGRKDKTRAKQKACYDHGGGAPCHPLIDQFNGVGAKRNTSLEHDAKDATGR